MIENEEKQLLDEIMKDSSPVLFLGAGFSKGSKNENNTLDGKGIWNLILESLVLKKADESDIDEIKGYNLRRLCEYVYTLYGGKKELTELLTSCFKGTKPDGNKFHLKLTSYPWKKIFTVNIDDLIENIYKANQKDYFVQNSNRLSQEPEDRTIIYKLHGCVNRPEEGYVFAESEYTELITKKIDPRLNRFTEELQHNNVIFVGASMDEPDIEYYLKIYEDAGCKYRRNKLIFIDSMPSLYLRNKVKSLDATLIKATAEEFLDYIQKLNFCPDELQRALINLNYCGIYRLSDLEKTYLTPYESRLYSGNFCKWQDVADGWVAEIRSYDEAKDKLDMLLTQEKGVCCFSIYGQVFTGKSCLLKTLAYYLNKKGFEVLEYKGKFINTNVIWKYMAESTSTKFVLVIDGGSYYYEQIEKMFSQEIMNKKIVILTAAREYYHKKKRYYLEGNPYVDYRISASFSREDAEILVDKLDSKAHLSFMASMKPREQREYVFKRRSMVNLILNLTYGKLAEKIGKAYRFMLPTLSEMEQRLLLELAIFDTADIEYYPRELFVEKYGSCVKMDSDVSIDKMRVVDYARMDERGLALRNSLLNNCILEYKKNEVEVSIIDILIYISRYVKERNNDIWYFVFQCLTKEEILERRFKLEHRQIEKIYLSVKENYMDISYYWLQMGLLFQKREDYISAYNYLEKSSSIRPNSYKIQHAMARNFLRHANCTKDIVEAKNLFTKGEEKMKKLIDSKDYGKEKAKPFSVTCYVSEKIKFMMKFNIVPSDKELQYLINSLDSVKNSMDDYMETVYKSFYAFLVNIHKQDMIRMDFSSPYLKYIGNPVTVRLFDNNEDPIIEAIN